MTEYERMISGQPFDPVDPELWKLHLKGWRFNRQYNDLPAEMLKARESMLRETLAHLGTNARVNQPFLVDYGCNISIGDNTLVNLGCTFLDTGPITIGSNVLIAPDVKIYTAIHPMDAADRFQPGADGTLHIVTKTAPVVIGDGCWIGGGAIILPGVTIGKNVVVGAGGVVTKDIPDNAVAYGNPARMKENSLTSSNQLGGIKL